MAVAGAGARRRHAASTCSRRSSAGARASTRRSWRTSGARASRASRVDGALRDLAEEIALAKTRRHDIELVVDRIVVRETARAPHRRVDRDGAAHGAPGSSKLDLGAGARAAPALRAQRLPELRLSLSGARAAPLLVQQPGGACAACDGLGTRDAFDEARIVPDRGAASPDGAIDALAPRLLLPGAARRGRVAPRHRPRHALARAAEARRVALLHGLGDERVSLALPRRGKSDRVLRRFDGVLGELARRAEALGADAAELAQLPERPRAARRAPARGSAPRRAACASAATRCPSSARSRSRTPSARCSRSSSAPSAR